MLHLRRKNREPPGGWYYYVDSERIKRGTFDKTVAATKRFLEINKKNVPDNLAELVEDQICRRIPASLVVEPIFDKFPRETRINEQTRRAIELFRKAGCKQDDASLCKRYTTCATCDYNTWRHGCFDCSATYKLVRGAFVNIPKIPLFSCDIVACYCMALCNLPKIELDKFVTQEQLENVPKSCWLFSVSNKPTGVLNARH